MCMYIHMYSYHLFYRRDRQVRRGLGITMMIVYLRTQKKQNKKKVRTITETKKIERPRASPSKELRKKAEEQKQKNCFYCWKSKAVVIHPDVPRKFNGDSIYICNGDSYIDEITGSPIVSCFSSRKTFKEIADEKGEWKLLHY
jgi:hypothetical protein